MENRNDSTHNGKDERGIFIHGRPVPFQSGVLPPTSRSASQGSGRPAASPGTPSPTLPASTGSRCSAGTGRVSSPAAEPCSQS